MLKAKYRLFLCRNHSRGLAIHDSKLNLSKPTFCLKFYLGMQYADGNRHVSRNHYFSEQQIVSEQFGTDKMNGEIVKPYSNKNVKLFRFRNTHFTYNIAQSVSCSIYNFRP